MESNIDLSGNCLAILEQGKKKGERCWRPKTKNGYCGKHQTQALLEKGKEDGKRKCKRFRCTNLIDKSDKNLYCISCIENKKEERKELKTCIATIQQHDNKGKNCEKLASKGDYCGKHYEYNMRLQEAAAKNIRICDDGKRACKNPTIDRKLKCEDCLAKNRENDAGNYAVRQMDITKCLGCGITIEQCLKGLRGKDVQQCKNCYEKQRKIEESRERIERDFNKERKSNIDKHMNEYISSSYKRGKPFELTKEEFEQLVTGICAYCGFKSETVIGIDRINSEKGYTVDNSVPCCADCNQIKGSKSPEELKEHITKMYFHMLDNTSTIQKGGISEEAIGKSWLRPSEILSIVNKKKIDEYIQWCKEDERSPAFITKLDELKNTTMNYCDTLAYIKNALRTESNKQKKNITNTRQRMSKEELYGFLEISAPAKFIEHYEAAHGKSEALNKEVETLFTKWKNLSTEEKQSILTKSLVRLQNLRNRK